MIAFESTASNLDSRDSNGAVDVFVHNRRLGVTQLVGLDTDGTQFPHGTSQAEITPDGRYVAFTALGTGGSIRGLYMRDLELGTTERVNGDYRGAASAGGRYLAYQRIGCWEVRLVDRLRPDTTTRLHTSLQAAQNPSITPDGRFVVFDTYDNVVPCQTFPGGYGRTILYDRQTGQSTRIEPLLVSDFEPAISADGRYVSVTSGYVYLKDRSLPEPGWVEPVRRYSGGDASLSGQGRYMAFTLVGQGEVPTDPSSNEATDVMVYDQEDGALHHASVGRGDVPAGGSSSAPRISLDGRVVAFESEATNLIANDTNGMKDIFVRILDGFGSPESLPCLPRVHQLDTSTVGPSGGQIVFSVSADDVCEWTAESAADWLTASVTRSTGNGQVVVTVAPNAGEGARSGRVSVANHIYLIAQSGSPCTAVVTPASGEIPSGGGSFSLEVRTNLPTCPWAARLYDSRETWLSITAGLTGTGSGRVTVNAGALQGVGRRTNGVVIYRPQVAGSVAPAFDSTLVWISQSGGGTAGDIDADTLPDVWERQFGVSAASAGGDDGASGDPDGDGRTNAEEYRDGTHPRGIHARYLAEGATGQFFQTRLAILNTSTSGGVGVLRFLRTAGEPVRHVLTLPARTRITIDPATFAGLATAEFSVTLESDVDVVMDRTMSWSSVAYGAHAESAVKQRSVVWYLAEGSTRGGFDLFYLLQNPGEQPVDVKVTYLRDAGQVPLEKTYTVPAKARYNIWVNQEQFASGGNALASADVSAVIQSVQGTPIVVERAMYLSTSSQPYAAGHESAGVTSPSTQWFLAEGATGAYFDLFVLIANPTQTDAYVEVTYLLPGGTTVTKHHTAPANGRYNIWVDLEDSRVADTAVSTTLRVLNNVPVIVERAMWWPGTANTWTEAHNSPGATVTSKRWALAEGEAGGSRGTSTYILIANTSTVSGPVKVTLFYEDGTASERTFTLAPRSRFNVDVGSEVPSATGRRFSALVESIGEAHLDLVVERAMYWDAAGQTWAAGTNALATPLQ